MSVIVEHFTSGESYASVRHTPDEQPDNHGRLPNGCEGPVGKPLGMWVSCPGGNPSWDEWCIGESFHLDRLAYKHTFEVDESKVLMIRTMDEIVAFHERYKIEWVLGNMGPRKVTRMNIRWRDVCFDYQGIVIPHYFWSCRLGTFGDREDVTHEISNWYYGWDCASGCIWEPGALRHISTEAHDWQRQPRPLQLEEEGD